MIKKHLHSKGERKAPVQTTATPHPPATNQEIINALETIEHMSMNAVVTPNMGDRGTTAQTVSWALDQLRHKEALEREA